MNCTSLSLYASSVHVICINNKHLSVYKTGDKFVFPHYIVWCITCMVVTCIFPHGGHMFIPHAGHVYIPHLISPIESSTKTPLWGFVLFIILLNVKLLYLYQKQYNSCKYLQCRGSAWFDKSCFLWRRVRLFPGMLESYMERSY